MDSKFKPLEVVYCVDRDTQRVFKAIWWNWKSRCNDNDFDIVTTNETYKDSKIGVTLPEQDKITVHLSDIFKTKREAINSLIKTNE